VVPDAYPFAFTNVFAFDLDGDGKFAPPKQLPPDTAYWGSSR
jgi:hypothetical protein